MPDSLDHISENETRQAGQYEIQTLQRALDVLDCFLTEDRASYQFAELERRSGLPKSTLFRILANLVGAEYLQRHRETESYSLGRKLLNFGASASHLTELRWDSVPVVDELAQRCGETAYVGVLDRGDVVTVYVKDGTYTVRMHSWVGKRREAHCSAMGKALLAHKPPEFVRSYGELYEMKAYTKNTVTSIEQLERDLEQVRETGLAVDNEEVELGLRCIAAPIFGRTGQVVAAVCISGPTSRISSERVDDLGLQVSRAAERVSRSLGYEGQNR